MRYHPRPLVWKVLSRVQDFSLKGDFRSSVFAVLNLNRLPDFNSHCNLQKKKSEAKRS